jgi:hypothetical protein
MNEGTDVSVMLERTDLIGWAHSDAKRMASRSLERIASTVALIDVDAPTSDNDGGMSCGSGPAKCNFNIDSELSAD